MEYMAHFWLIYHIHLEFTGGHDDNLYLKKSILSKCNWGKHNAVITWWSDYGYVQVPSSDRQKHIIIWSHLACLCSPYFNKNNP